MSIDQSRSGPDGVARLRADILRAYRRCTRARQAGADQLAEIAENEMNRLLDQLPRPRLPLDDVYPDDSPDG